MSGTKTVLACEALKVEFEAVIGHSGIDLRVMEIALHRTPQKMPEKLAEAIGRAETEGAGEIIMGYGLCSNGVVGLSSSRGLRIARCHDCLGLLLGSPERYQRVFKEYPGTFFFFAGLMAAEFDPLSTLERDYAPRLGLDKAKRAMSLALKNYTPFAYIETKADTSPRFKARYLENCAAFDKAPMELESDLSYFHRLVHGPADSIDIISLSGGEALRADAFYDPSIGSDNHDA